MEGPGAEAAAAVLKQGADLAQVRRFWEQNPLWQGESRFPEGSAEFFDEHRRVCVEDCFAGTLDRRFLPQGAPLRVLDLGCGIGFWTVELGRGSRSGLVAADLTFKGLQLARRRCHLNGVQAGFCQQNAESLGFRGGVFGHVNCQGVIHHSPDTEACVREIARVLAPGGTAYISVYYRNLPLKAWPYLSWLGRGLSRLGGGLRGRGREGIFSSGDPDEVVRLYDGKDNPVGKAYDREAFRRLVTPLFRIEESFLHFFPARALPFPLPRFLHRLLDRHMGFMIHARLRKA